MVKVCGVNAITEARFVALRATVPTRGRRSKPTAPFGHKALRAFAALCAAVPV